MAINKIVAGADNPIPCDGIYVASTYTSSITIDANQTYQVGKLVIVNIRFTVTQNTATGGAPIILGLPQPKTSIATGQGFLCLCHNRISEFSISIYKGTSSGRILPRENLTPQVYFVSGVYVCE